MTAKEYLENEAKIWGKVDDDNITKSVIIQIAEGYAKHLIDKYNTDLCEFAEWLGINGWVWSHPTVMWRRVNRVSGYAEQKTTSQLRERWEVETGRREP